MKTQTVIGLEMHCEMLSNSKVFSPSLNNFDKRANFNVSEIDFAFPGTLPTLNMECVRKAIKAATILNCTIPSFMEFDRKNYYYPDLPKGYQITQNTHPVGVNGYIDVECKDKIKRIYISDIHLEEDSARLDHLESMSLIDYNRSGVPLLECVTTPCIESADDALCFVDAMIKVYRYTDISLADTKKGQVRCDVNISLKDEDGNFLTPKIEVKNVNSLSNIKKTIIYEENRLRKALENNEELFQETRRFDEASETTVFMRSKADALDYKYFIEPNIPPFIITDELKDSIKNEIPRLHLERKLDYRKKYNLDDESINAIVKNKDIADYFENCIEIGLDAKIASNYINGLIISYLYKEEMDIKDFYITPLFLKEIVDAQKTGKISSKQAKEIFAESLDKRVEPKSLIDNTDSQISDDNLLESIIDSILLNNQNLIEEYKNGRDNIFDFFVGQVMKETRGKANPILTKEILNKKLN